MPYHLLPPSVVRATNVVKAVTQIKMSISLKWLSRRLVNWWTVSSHVSWSCILGIQLKMVCSLWSKISILFGLKSRLPSSTTMERGRPPLPFRMELTPLATSLSGDGGTLPSFAWDLSPEGYPATTQALTKAPNSILTLTTTHMDLEDGPILAAVVLKPIGAKKLTRFFNTFVCYLHFVPFLDFLK